VVRFAQHLDSANGLWHKKFKLGILGRQSGLQSDTDVRFGVVFLLPCKWSPNRGLQCRAAYKAVFCQMNKENEVAGSGAPDSVPKKGIGAEDVRGARDVPKGALEASDDYNMQEILDDNIGALLELMTELKADITDEWRKIKEGQVNEKDLTRKIKVELPALVQLTMQQESKLHDHTSQRAARAGEFALDLGSARTAIGERLARLRNTRATDGISERVE
jgi:hypothetical protein